MAAPCQDERQVRRPGAHCLHCGLCATARKDVRAVCVGCGELMDVALREVEGGAIRAGTCDVCHGYTTIFYQDKTAAVEAMADDLASLGPDLMVSDAG